MAVFEDAIWFTVVALLWGFTNPFIAKGSRAAAAPTPGAPWRQRIYEGLAGFLLNWRYLLPLVLNLSGSVVYYHTLSHADVSLAVPVTNSLTFVFTALAGKLVGEDLGTHETWLGMALVVAGVYFCVTGRPPTAA